MSSRFKGRRELSGSAKMYRIGKKPVLMWFTEDEHNAIKNAAQGECRSMANYVRNLVLRATGLEGTAPLRKPQKKRK